MEKKIIQLLAGVLLIMYTSCTNEALVEERSEGIKLHISTAGNKTRASVDPGSNPENAITNIAVWFFQKAANDDSEPLLFHLEKDLGNTYSGYDIKLGAKELNAAKISSDGTYDIYIVAVPTDQIPSVEGIVTLKDLKDIIYEGKYTNSTKDGRPVSPFTMSGCLLEHNFANDHAAVVTLVRLATRLHISWVNETGLSTLAGYEVTVENDAKNVGLFVPVADGNIKRFSNAEKKKCKVAEDKECTAYINEYMGANSVIIQIQAFQGGTKYNWQIPIVYDGNKTQLFRNTSYELNVRLKPYGATLLLNELNWDEIIDDGEQSGEPV